jgi:hypothetical protein
MLSVMDHSGCFIHLLINLGKSETEVLTSIPLFLEEGKHFSQMECLRGQGCFNASF